MTVNIEKVMILYVIMGFAFINYSSRIMQQI